MQKVKELRMALVILVIGMFFISGCFFDKKYEVTFKTNGGTKLDSLVIKSGDKLEDIEAPTKDGYKFLGWYSNGKEFDFDEKIEEDITLVAKWEKIEVDYEQEEVEEDTTTTTQKTTTTKKTTTSKKSTTSKKTTTSKITTTKTTTTTKIEDETTTSTTTVASTTTTTTSTTTTTTTSSIVDITTKPITTVVPPVEEEVITTKPVEVKMAIYEVQKSIDDETTEEDETSYVITIDLDNDTPTVVSNISNEDYASLINSDKTKWVIENNNEYVYENIYNIDDANKIKLESNKTGIISLLIFDGNNHYSLDYDSINSVWSLNYPVVTVGVGLDVKYYGNIDLAFIKALEGDTVTLLKDIELKQAIRLYDVISINGNGYKLSSSDFEIFVLESLNKPDKQLVIDNLIIDSYNFMNVSSDTVLDKITINNCNIKYKNLLFNEDINVLVDYENTEITTILN